MVIGSLQHMATGFGRTILPRLESLVRHCVMFYFWLFKSQTVDYYNRAIQVFLNSPVTTPACFFFCENDPMCDPDAMEEVIDLWSRRGVTVVTRKWKESVHARHLRRHPEEYMSTLKDFFKLCNFSLIRAKM
ncbi:hypothetical protein DPEC_G00115040 [Dallia pectoralis]|uniref:Uncharacterized protein n=1 Tax=Dallia pectoralis TaxID=75939 RepID=A0ACC2GTU6_DALPE|nr:hypothetical protein DPEC_G00115040 [Dallia pectoralis]